MKAELLLDERHVVGGNAFVEIVIWRVPRPIAGSSHPLKYRLAFVVDGNCVVRYDNEAGKGDHRHVGRREYPYRFTDHRAMLADFWADVDKWRERHEDRDA